MHCYNNLLIKAGEIIMKRGSIMKSRTTIRLLAVALICTWIPTVAAWGASPPAALFAQPLNQIPVPEPPNLFQFVKSKSAAIKLGKAFFWDMQAGSDGIQACASCHFHAGVDNRLKNTVNPGARGGDSTFQVRGPNDTLQLTDFPFHQRQNPDFQASPVIRDFNDVVGSQGVKLTDFVAINAGSAGDSGTPVADTVFQAGGVNMRQVTARNTPSVINAIFNFNNFWDGRAHFLFNGVNPFGPLDTTAGVWFSDAAGNLTKQKISIEMGSLASQATGPPLDTTEMSFRGRTFPQLGKKMLSLTPLGKQVVHPDDSVLGPNSRAVAQQNGTITGQPGLNSTYDQMIRDAFVDTFYKSGQLTTDGFTQMEANFSLFWGLAIQLYEATLVSDQTPFDRLLGGDSTAITNQQEIGMNIFFSTGKCDACHAGTELTSATATAAAFVTNNANGLIDQMVAGDRDAIYDIGYNSTGVRPMAEDIGRGGDSPFTNPLTGLFTPLGFCALAELQALGNLPFPSIVLPDQLPVNFPVSNNGAFKVPGLRNIELTAPYFHDGSVMTLEDVVDFYTRGGNFPSLTASPDLDFNITEIGSLQNAPDKMAAMVEFFKSLTDERVRNHSAPFDHPELFIPEGADAGGNDIMTRIAARDAFGNAAPTIALTLDPVATPTNLTSQIIGGTKEIGATILISINNGTPLPPDTVTDIAWSTTIAGLADGNNVITVTANATTTITTNITVDRTLPALTLAPVTSPTASAVQTISGTVEPGITPLVSVNTSAIVGPVTAGNGNWSAQISGLVSGANFVVIAAVDPAGNFVARTATISFSSTMDISSALRALRIAVQLDSPTPADMQQLDVAPLANGVPTQSGNIEITDALLILQNAVGLVTW